MRLPNWIANNDANFLKRMRHMENLNILEETARRWLIERGVTVEDIAELVMYLQKKYHPNLKIEDCIYNIERVLEKERYKMPS